jgi:hypothetical protein
MAVNPVAAEKEAGLIQESPAPRKKRPDEKEGLMLWIGLALVAGTVVVTVSAWARSVRIKAEAAEAARREQHRVRMEEQMLLAKLNRPEEG